MAELTLTELSVRAPQATLSGLSGTASGKRIALVGEWSPLFSLLSGRVGASQGRVTIDDRDAREAVMDGSVGLVDSELTPLPGRSVAQWLTAYARLRGFTEGHAQQAAEETLSRLGVAYLARYTTDDVPGAGLYAARVALAMLTQPSVLVADAPPWSVQSQPLSHALLEQVTLGSDLIVRCDPSEQPELFCSCDSALLSDGRSATLVDPPEHLGARARTYRVRTWGKREELVSALRGRGAQVITPAGGGELWVTLPEGEGTALVVEAALESRAGLERMSPLLELPRAE